MELSFQTPLEIRSQIWKGLNRAVHDKHHSWRTPVLSTLAIDGGVNSRTVVLRGVDDAASKLTVYTDARSLKVAELNANSKAVFVFWSQRLHWQLRVKVNISILTTGQQVETLWERVKQSAAAFDYISPLAPGSKLINTTESSTLIKSNDHHIAVLIASVDEIDWLELSIKGHRRARFNDTFWEWLAP